MAKPGAMAVALAENRRLKERIAYLEAKLDVIQQWHGQFQDDIMTIVLADADVMGKDTFGPKRIARITEARDRLWDELKQALDNKPESDYLRETIDRRLRQIMQEQAAPWPERYFGWEE